MRWCLILAALALMIAGCKQEEPTNVTTSERVSEPSATTVGVTPSESDNKITVTAADYSFTPSEIRAKPGQKIQLTLTNNGTHEHNIEFELPGGEVMLDSALKSGETRTLEVTAPTQVGNYEYYCPVGNHRSEGMKGTLVVEGP